MAPKRAAPPPPPAASSEETASGSGSDESDDEEEIAHSPPPAAPKAPPPQKGQEAETDGEEEDDEEEEEEEEEEENKKVNHAPPPAVPKNSPPPPPNREASEDEDEEDEETDDEAPQPKPAPTQKGEGKVAKPSSGEDKKPAAPFQRTWSTEDEIRILEALAAHRREHGVVASPDALFAALAGSLDNRGCNRRDLQVKLGHLKRRYDTVAKRGEVPRKSIDRRLFDLSKEVWGAGSAANGSARREYGEMCELYPYLAEEVKALEVKHPGLFKREFSMIADDKARALDAKIKKQRMVLMKLELRRYDLTKEVTKTLMELVD